MSCFIASLFRIHCLMTCCQEQILSCNYSSNNCMNITADMSKKSSRCTTDLYVDIDCYLCSLRTAIAEEGSIYIYLTYLCYLTDFTAAP